MKKTLIIITIMLLFFSCTKKTEFIKSKTIADLFLLKNPPQEDSLVKKLVKDFLLKNPPKYKNKINRIDFYIYNSDTKYFLDHGEDNPSGLSLGEQQLNFYNNYRIAIFSISKCKNNEKRLVGELQFDNKYGDFYKPDTIIYKCK
ncbi:hypothetical protein [Flavobacterium hibernum]|uniref:Lipoprotein n=1 Tax=Flavobacterium hibernum TaxID=37752 RepID=A0ABX4CAQ5_9FLAO|nr:hypothetical protein [Flavobacterium hibernum]OXA90189.1 hypothetical protein B0A73_03955 [Flavobacterium hibernum]STO18687.1 Uncharacterised protein [Flavobacterium hibernum]